MISARTLLLGLTLSAFVVSISSAAPPPRWRKGGNPICSAAGRQSSPSAIRAGAAGVIVAWNDERRGAGLNDIYAQRVQLDGALGFGWPVDGVLVAADAVLAHVQSDQADGALFLWQVPGGQVRAQHLLADGTRDPLVPAGGRLIASGIGGPSWSSFVVSPDGSGGTYVLYVTFDGSVEHVMLTRVDASGVALPGWSPPIEVASWAFGFGGFTGFSLATLPSGRIAVGWGIRSEGFIGADYFGRIRAYLPDGTPVYNTDLNIALGLEVVPAPVVVAGASDDVYVQIPGTGLTQRFNGSGLPVWPPSPSVIAGGTIRPDLAGGLYLTQFDLQSFVVNRLDPTGARSVGWPAEGVAITRPFDPSNYDIEVGSEGVVFAWAESPGEQVRVTLVGAAGAVGAGWNPEGERAGRAHGRQSQPTVVPLGAESAFVAWTDERRRGEDIYANRIVVDPPAVASEPGPPADRGAEQLQRVHIASLQGWRLAGGIRLTGSVAEPGAARLDLFDVSGRRVSGTELALARGAFDVRFSAPGLQRGIYWLRLSVPGATATRRVVLIDG